MLHGVQRVWQHIRRPLLGLLRDRLRSPKPLPRSRLPGRTAMSRATALTTLDLCRLDRACHSLYKAWGFGTYLVGTAVGDGPYRDVDVRLILDDDEFDRLFGSENGRQVWAVMSEAIATLLREQTGLPVDFQIQRRTEANEKHYGLRYPLGHGRGYAGGGDGTGFDARVLSGPTAQEDQ